MSDGSVAGRVIELWRYPVKSMRGERLPRTDIGERGVRGDRVLALIDPQHGGVVSAKQPRKWRRLLECEARLLEEGCAGSAPAVLVRLPDGGEVRSDDPRAAAALSDLLGRPVTLSTRAGQNLLRETLRPAVPELADEERLGLEQMARGAPGTFFDYAPVHVLTSTTLRRLRALTPGNLDVTRFRPNIVIETESEGFVEQEWLGRTLAIGDTRLDVIDPTPRCVVTTLPQAGLPANPDLLRALAATTSSRSLGLAPGRTFRAVVGVYARVLVGGRVEVGAAVQLL